MCSHAGREIITDAIGNCIVEPSFIERSFMQPAVSLEAHSLLAYINSMRTHLGLRKMSQVRSFAEMEEDQKKRRRELQERNNFAADDSTI